MNMRRIRRTPRFAAQRGFTMFEILITLFLLAMWLLGSAGVQSASLQYNKAAQFRTQAVYFATDLAERMQTNKKGATDGNYAYAGSGAAMTTDCMTASCSPPDLAAFDLAEVSARVTAALPGGTVTAQPLAVGNPVTYTIVVSWVDRRNDRSVTSSGQTESFTYTTTKTIFDTSSL